MLEEEKQYRKQLMPNTELEEYQLIEEEQYKKLMKQNKGETTMQELEIDEKTIVEIEKSEAQYRRQTTAAHGVSEEKCNARIQDQKDKDKKEYEESQKQWRKMKHGRLSDD